MDNLKNDAEVLDEDLYWLIIAKSLEYSDNPETQIEVLISTLQQHSPEEIIGFELRTSMLLCDIYTSEVWCAAYLLKGGCSDDGFEYFRNWVISRGKRVYYATRENSDSLVDEINEDEDLFESEDFQYVAIEAFERKTKKDLYEELKNQVMICPDIKFNWEDDDPDSMRQICPRLFAKFSESYPEQ